MPRCRSMPNISQSPSQRHWNGVQRHQSSGIIGRPSTSPMVGTLGLPPAAPCKVTTNAGECPVTISGAKFAKRSSGMSLRRPSTSDSSNGLPPKGSLQPLLATDSLMVIEGTQTGEERLIDITAARETEPIKETVPRDFSRYRKTAEGGKRERRLEAEVKRLQHSLSLCNKELASLRQGSLLSREIEKKWEESRQLNAELDNNLRIQQEKQRVQDLVHTQERERLGNALAEQKMKFLELSADADFKASSATKEQTELIESLRRQIKKSTDGRTELEDTIRTLKEELRDNERSRIDSQAKSNSLEGRCRTREELVMQLKAALAEEASSVEKHRQEAKELRGTLIFKEASVIESDKKAHQMLEYITKICQPHFAVVKDESLTPVNISGFQVTEGHVLVPLILLLEGYALLPPQLKSAIDNKSNKLNEGIDYGYSYKTTSNHPPPVDHSYKNRLYSMMEEKQHPQQLSRKVPGALGISSGSTLSSWSH